MTAAATIECAACEKPAEENGYCTGHAYLADPSWQRMIDVFNAHMAEADGTARHRQWSCEDGYIVCYTTERTKGGPNPGKFEVIVYKPIGKGARSGKAREWVMCYRRPFVKRGKAKQRALVLFYRHSPKLAEKHKWTGKGYGDRVTLVLSLSCGHRRRFRNVTPQRAASIAETFKRASCAKPDCPTRGRAGAQPEVVGHEIEAAR